MPSWNRTTAFAWRCAVVLAVATGLVASPWLPLSESIMGAAPDAGQSMSGLAAWHAPLVGGVLALLTIICCVRPTAWLFGLQLILGLWIVLAPWAVDLGAEKATPWLYGAAGLIVVAIASMEIYWKVRREREIIQHMS